MYPGPPARESPRTQLPLDRIAAVPQPVLAHAARGEAEPDGRDVVVVEPGRLARHPGQHPGVHPLVLVEELVSTPLRVDVDEGRPEVRAPGDPARDLLELLGERIPSCGTRSSRPARAGWDKAGIVDTSTILRRRSRCWIFGLAARPARASARVTRRARGGGSRSRLRISQTESETMSVRIPVSAQMSARLNASAARSPCTTIGFGTRRPFHAADVTLPSTPAASSPAAGGIAADGTRTRATVAARRTTQSAIHAGERSWYAHHGVGALALRTRSATASGTATASRTTRRI